MANDQNRPLSIAERKLQAEADAVLAQMFEYFTREDTPRPAVTEFEANRAA